MKYIVRELVGSGYLFLDKKKEYNLYALTFLNFHDIYHYRFCSFKVRYQIIRGRTNRYFCYIALKR